MFPISLVFRTLFPVHDFHNYLKYLNHNTCYFTSAMPTMHAFNWFSKIYTNLMRTKIWKHFYLNFSVVLVLYLFLKVDIFVFYLTWQNKAYGAITKEMSFNKTKHQGNYTDKPIQMPHYHGTHINNQWYSTTVCKYILFVSFRVVRCLVEI